jgi:hypothetical protein
MGFEKMSIVLSYSITSPGKKRGFVGNSRSLLHKKTAVKTPMGSQTSIVANRR